MPLERRRPDHVRFPVRVPALMIGGAKSWWRPTPGETRNISRGGVRLRVEEATIPSNQVEVTLRLVYRPPLTLTGTVVWSAGQPDPPGRDLGIQFNEEIPRQLVAEIAYEGFRGWAGPSDYPGGPVGTEECRGSNIPGERRRPMLPHSLGQSPPALPARIHPRFEISRKDRVAFDSLWNAVEEWVQAEIPLCGTRGHSDAVSRSRDTVRGSHGRIANVRPRVTGGGVEEDPGVGGRGVGCESSDRVADLSYRMMAWTFRVADLLFPKRDRLGGFGLQAGFVVVDYGCGPGRYLAEASRLVGPTGRVYAVDIHPLAIRDVERLKAKLNLTNVVPVLADGYSCAVPDHAADLIYALDMFHAVKDAVALLAEWHRIAKPHGVLILEDGHQSRRRTKEKLAQAGLWRIEREERAHVRCVVA